MSVTACPYGYRYIRIFRTVASTRLVEVENLADVAGFSGSMEMGAWKYDPEPVRAGEGSLRKDFFVPFERLKLGHKYTTDTKLSTCAWSECTHS